MSSGEARGWTDIHSHLFSGVDDGAQTPGEAAEGVATLRAEGVDRIVTTPHLDGSLTLRPGALAARLAELDDAWAELEELRSLEFPDLRLGRGTEVKLDVPEPDVSDARLRLEGGAAVLVEFPHLMVPPNALRPLLHLRKSGWRPVIAHAERYRGFREGLGEIEDWRSVGAAIQVNAASVVGLYGAEARQRALLILERGWADCLASDYHARGRPALRDAASFLEERDAAQQVKLLLEVNPRRLVEGEPPLPVPGVKHVRALWTRVVSWVRRGA